MLLSKAKYAMIPTDAKVTQVSQDTEVSHVFRMS